MTRTPRRFVIPEDLERVPARWPLGGLRLTSRELCWLVALSVVELVLVAALVPALGIGPLAGVVLAVPVVLGWSLMRLRIDGSSLDGHFLALVRYWMGPRLLSRRRQPVRRTQWARLPNPLYHLHLKESQSATIARHRWGFRVTR